MCNATSLKCFQSFVVSQVEVEGVEVEGGRERRGRERAQVGRIECGWILYNPIAWSFSLRIIAFTSIHYSIIHGIFLAHFITRPHKFQANDEKELSFVLNPLIVYRFECMQLVSPTIIKACPACSHGAIDTDFIETHTLHHIGFVHVVCSKLPRL